MKKCKVLLLSGGADSMLLLQDYEFDKKVFFDYGQPHLDEELDKCKAFVTETIKLPAFARKNSEVNCRNLTFILNVVSSYGGRDLDIYIGTNKDDVYRDNSRSFYNEVEVFVNKISLNKVKIKTPLIQIAKSEILKRVNYKFYTD